MEKASNTVPRLVASWHAERWLGLLGKQVPHSSSECFLWLMSLWMLLWGIDRSSSVPHVPSPLARPQVSSPCLCAFRIGVRVFSWTCPPVGSSHWALPGNSLSTSHTVWVSVLCSGFQPLPRDKWFFLSFPNAVTLQYISSCCGDHNHEITLLRLHYCKFATVMDCSINS